MKRIIASGNCQAGEVKNILLRADLGEDVSVKWRKSFENDFFRGDTLTDDDYAKCDIYLKQVGSWVEEDSKISLLSKRCNIVRFPAMSLDSLWPLGFHDPRNKECGVNGFEPYPHGAADRLAFTLKKQGLNEDSVIDRYFSTDVREFANVDRAAQVFHEKAILVDDQADEGMSMQAYIDQHFLRQRLFLTRNHPTGQLMAELLRKIIANSALGEWIKNGDHLIAVTERSRGIGDFDDPIHPQVADHFKVAWATQDMTYAYYHEGRFDFTERLRRYLRFQYNRDLMLFRREIGAGRLGQETLLLALKAVTYDPRNWYTHLNLAELYRKLGANKLAIESLRVSSALDPSSWASYHLVASMLLAEMRLDEAAEAQLQAVECAPDKGAAYFQLGLIRERMGDISEASENYDQALKLEPNSQPIKSAAKRMEKAA